MKILNLYCGIGGNRKNWPSKLNGEKIEVTAVELNPEIAKIYQDFFPEDKVIVGDAHQYLLEHFQEFDFIWSSPPCPTHSRINNSFNGCNNKRHLIRYPDMKLYEEIILMLKYNKKKFVIENVIPYYEPLIKPTAIRERHCFWANFKIPSKPIVNSANQRIAFVNNNSVRFGIDLKNFKIKNKRQILRNLVNPKLGLHIFNCAFREQQLTLK